jgi:hypothetical protein
MYLDPLKKHRWDFNAIRCLSRISVPEFFAIKYYLFWLSPTEAYN